MRRPSILVFFVGMFVFAFGCSGEDVGNRSDAIKSCYDTGYGIKCVSTPGAVEPEATDVDGDDQPDVFLCGDGVSESDSDGDADQDSDGASTEDETAEGADDELDADSESASESQSESDDDCADSGEDDASDSESDAEGDGDADGVSDADDCDCLAGGTV